MSIETISQGAEFDAAMSVFGEAVDISNDAEFRKDFIVKNGWHSFVGLECMEWETAQQVSIAAAELSVEKFVAVAVQAAVSDETAPVRVLSLDPYPTDVLEVENYDYGHCSLTFDTSLKLSIFRYFSDFYVICGVPQFIAKVGVSVDRMRREYERDLVLNEVSPEGTEMLRSSLDRYFVDGR
ncbi:MAG: hypothetical protein MI806_29845 [Minwuiales bacterium]|nr:hypothetical protein [Minwuiales bacterium]